MKKIKILYGIQGTGNGHLSRSLLIMNHLSEFYGDRIESIETCISGSFSQLQTNFNPTYKFQGLELNFGSGQISILNTIRKMKVLETLKSAWKLDLTKYDCIVSDFEPITCWSGIFNKRKVLGIGNHYNFLNNKTFLNNLDPKFLSNKIIAKVISPVDQFISFDYLKSDTNFFPIIPKEIRLANVSNLGHYVFYLSTIPISEQIKFLSLFPKVKIFLFHPEIKNPENFENIEIFPINRGIFLEKLISSAGVVCHSGFQLTSECLFLGKKLMTIPITNQIEQLFNVKRLSSLGVPDCDWGNLEKFDHFFGNNFYTKLNYEDQMDQICEKILHHKS